MQSQWHSICPYLEKLIFLAFAIPQRASFRAFCRKSLDCAASLHLQGDQQSVCGKTNIQRVGIVLPLYMKAVGMCFNSMHHIDSLSGQSRWNPTGSGVGSGNPVGTRGRESWISCTRSLRTMIMLRSNGFSQTYRMVWNRRRRVSYRMFSTVDECTGYFAPFSYRTCL